MAGGEWSSPELAEKELLREFGPPHELAESYMPGPRILFGPRLYPAFIRAMKISISILGAVLAFGLVVDFSRMSSATEFWISVGDSIQNLVIGSIFVLGVVVTIFALIERSGGETPLTSDESWDPDSLLDEQDVDEVSVGEVVVGVVFLVLALAILNFFPDWVAIWVNLREHSGTVPLLTESFWSQLWLLNICLGLDLALSLVLLRTGRWSIPLLWVRVAITLLFVVWFSRLVYAGPVFEIDPDLLLDRGWPVSAVDHIESVVQGRLLPVLRILLRIGFAAAVIGFCIRVFNTTKRTLRSG